jgi:hypothetical protein
MPTCLAVANGSPSHALHSDNCGDNACTLQSWNKDITKYKKRHLEERKEIHGKS